MDKNLIAGPSNVIHVTVPSSVAHNLEQMTQVTRSIVAEFGCKGCHSGKTIFYHEEDNYIVDGALNVIPQPSPWLEK
ncbi:MAG TPA: hypothetical protein VFE53_11305 [Mucilaginibacter sp.]|jgi:hypothetical protein|nr:hypothetical protein [Mucilaginibacter sp.]